MTNLEEFIETLDRNRQKFQHEKIKRHFEKWNKSILYHFIDDDEFWHFHLTNGVPGPLTKGEIEKPDVKYEMSKATFLAIDRKEISGMKAYNQKLVKVKAKMPDLLKLQKIDKL